MNFQIEVEETYKRISSLLRKTPLVRSEFLSQKLGCDLFLKMDHLQPTHSFKVRGALSKVASLSEADRKRGLVTASAGNHGLGVCYAAQVFFTHAHVYLPNNTPKHKAEKIKQFGGEVVLHGDVWDDANRRALEAAEKQGFVYIHPFSDDTVITGQGTVAYEIFQDQPKMDAILCSVGGGGLISGIAGYAKNTHPTCKIYGVQTVGADSMYQSLEAGKIITLPAMTSIAESLGARTVSEKTFQYVKQYVDEVFTVTDDEALQALCTLLQEEKQLVEPAASCCLAALLGGKIPDIHDKKVTVVLCGANFQLNAVLAKKLFNA